MEGNNMLSDLNNANNQSDTDVCGYGKFLKRVENSVLSKKLIVKHNNREKLGEQQKNNTQ
ncbi:hypothetical protein OUZ56_024951 [Daphnia magna]|uniref:Uncharacterized protein n=1 Tax=Daphnia magna TaxID=35525 RepID=A0ABQ9ZJH7_9CRUS|nr:hypothetical protein OUZ56_024941 [Daphnia magna]KAK4012715.1 hypothetical protein OUZ56_024951 [Daphnia magna]